MKKIFILWILMIIIYFNGFSQTLFSENFESYITNSILNTTANSTGWRTLDISNTTNKQNHWCITYNKSCNNNGTTSLSIGDVTSANTFTSCIYNVNNSRDVTAYNTFSSVNYTNLQLTFTWKCIGEFDFFSVYDYGQVGYSTDGVTWQYLSPLYYNASSMQTATVSLPSSLNNLPIVYFGFRWKNDNSAGSSPAFVVDNISISGTCTAPSTPGTITQPTNKCANSAGNIFSISPVAGATSYIWSVTGTGWSIPVNSTTISVNVTIGTGVGTVSVVAKNGCGISASRSTGNITPTVAPSIPLTITQPTSKCANSTGNIFSISPVAGATSYIWSVTGTGWSIPVSSTTTSVNVTIGTGVGSVSVVASNGCGNSPAQNTGNITPTTAPSTAGSITGISTVCQGQNNFTYTVSPITGATSYMWAYTGSGATILGSSNSVTINFSTTATSGNLTVKGVNNCGVGTSSADYAIIVSPLPSPPVAISGSASICEGSSQIYSTNASNATSYAWTVPSGWIINGVQSGNSINVTVGGSGGFIKVAAINACGSNTDVSQTANISPTIGTDNTGYVYAPVFGSDTKNSDGIQVYYNFLSDERTGYIKFDLSTLGAASSVTSASLILVNNGSGSTSANNHVVPLGNVDPVTADAMTIYNTTVGSSVDYNLQSWPQTGAFTLNLNSNAVTDISARISSPGYLSMGLYREDLSSATHKFYGYSAGANAPKLAVTYNGPINLAVTVKPSPGIVTVNPTIPITDCYGSINSLSASTSVGSGSLLNENFNAASLPVGWSTTNNSSGGTPVNAAWTLQPNAYTYISPEYFFFFLIGYDDYVFNSNDNSKFIISNSDAQGIFGNTATSLTSKAINTNGYQSLTLSFYDNFLYTTGDIASIQVSTNGINYTTIQQYASSHGSITDLHSSYTDGNGYDHYKYKVNFDPQSVNLNAYINQNTVYIRFNYTAQYGYWWAVDNVSVTGNAGAQNIVWSPTTNLFSNSQASTPYDPLATPNQNTVYAKILSNQTYTATVTGANGCSSFNSIAVNLSTSPIWTGLKNSDWNDITNWCNGATPTSVTNVIIPSATPYPPILNADGYSTNNIDIASGATLSLNGHDFTINGTYPGNGSITGSPTSKLTINGNAGILHFSPNVFPSNPTNNYLKTFTLTSGSTATLGDSLNIATGTYTSPGILTSNGTLTTGGLLTLKSDVNGDAMIANANGRIIGQSTVERYINPRRAWRFLTAPFSNNATYSSITQTINQAWQEGLTNTAQPTICPTGNGPSGLGMYITNGQASANGYDWNTTSSPSLKVWDGNGWTAPSSTTGIKITSYPAYYTFVRGDRNVCIQYGQFAPATTTVLRAKGQLNELGSSVSPTLGTYTAGTWAAIGNPFASPINFETGITSTGLDFNNVYILDPAVGGSYGAGGYILYSNQLPLPNQWLVVKGGTYGNYSINSPTVVQSGQAFLVPTTATNPTIQFTQNAKVTTEFNTSGLTVGNGNKTNSESGFSDSKSGYDRSVLYAELLLTDDSLNGADKVAVIYGNKYQKNDSIFSAKKIWSPYNNLSVWNNGFYAISCRPVAALTDTIFFKSYLTAGTNFTLKVYTYNVMANIPARGWLVDKYLNNKTEINLHDTTMFSFAATSDTNSYRNRFMVVFNRQLSTTPVPVTKVANQQNPNISGNAATIKSTESGINIYPNPVTDGIARLKFVNMDKGNYAIKIYNASGQLLTEKELMHNGGISIYPFTLNLAWPNGVYSVSVINKSIHKASNLKLIIGK